MRMLVADLENLLGKPGTAGVKDASGAGAAANKIDQAAVERLAAQGRPYDPADLDIGDAPGGPATQRTWLPWAVAGVLVVAAAAVYVGLSPPTPKPEPDRGPTSPPQERSLPEKRADTRSAPTEPTVEMRPTDIAPAPKPAPKPESKKSDPGTQVPPTVPAETKRPVERPRNNPRCSALLEKIQLGEPLSDEAKATFKKECSQ
jgi:hypothetical protein